MDGWVDGWMHDVHGRGWVSNLLIELRSLLSRVYKFDVETSVA